MLGEGIVLAVVEFILGWKGFADEPWCGDQCIAHSLLQ